ncbi:MAG: hypothetical protein K0R84_2211 [Clostridia bacterium]|jgi:hypothetical protein|nr:hypothetical protein [Clostridia bacterium]
MKDLRDTFKRITGLKVSFFLIICTSFETKPME